MEKSTFDALVAPLALPQKVPAEEWRALLQAFAGNERELLFERACDVASPIFGKRVYLRALIEISSYCRNGCRYCGLRSTNALAIRYRLDKEQILECCHKAARLGFNTFVLQGGEDPLQSDEWLADVVMTIKRYYPDKAVTLSVGERSAEGYAHMRTAGADRYLLRHETADTGHYSYLHTSRMSADNRKACLHELKRLGFQVGAGMMIGSPGQTMEHLVQDLMFLDELQPHMIGIGPFIPAKGTPFANEPPGSVEDTLLLIALLRMRFPRALIPATTALATLCSDGTERGILAGANVVMPNMTPLDVRNKYTIYDNKKVTESESAEQLNLLYDRLERIGYKLDFSRGDYNS